MIARTFNNFGLAGTMAQSERSIITVGVELGDIRGSDNRALQAAVDYIAGLGGGTVLIGEGRYLMRNTLILRDKVSLIGVPGKTVLVIGESRNSLLTVDASPDASEITLADPTGFCIGDGVAVRDRNNSYNTSVSIATLTARTGEGTFKLSRPLHTNYMVTAKANVSIAFPAVGGWGAKNLFIEGIAIEGNSKKAGFLDGCRGGGIFIEEGENITIRNCSVRDYFGDGIVVVGAYVNSRNVIVENCVSEKNVGLGLHPGNGSDHLIFRNNRSIGNMDGLYVCWTVQHSVFEDNEIRANWNVGIQTGHRDSDNIFRNNIIADNGRAGIYFRYEHEYSGAHRTVFENNKIVDNALAETILNDEDSAKFSTDLRPHAVFPYAIRGRASVLIQGEQNDIVFRNNTIGYTRAVVPNSIGIIADQAAKNLVTANNKFMNVEKEILIDNPKSDKDYMAKIAPWLGES